MQVELIFHRNSRRFHRSSENFHGFNGHFQLCVFPSTGFHQLSSTSELFLIYIHTWKWIRNNSTDSRDMSTKNMTLRGNGLETTRRTLATCPRIWCCRLESAAIAILLLLHLRAVGYWLETTPPTLAIYSRIWRCRWESAAVTIL